ncbi:thioesterase II family protein [Kroppenstedtia eburnea]|uniref:thioesterase II family protein n=1 Tax=Kroppenstedtia eburnea TaxID=714067 RepID=UPI003643ACBC
MRKIKLFCLPYAGGSATAIYGRWKKYLHPQIECFPIELAGRGRRFAEPLYTTWKHAVEELFDLVKPHLDGSPVAFFGYSMGSILAFELAHKMKDWNEQDPVHLFLAARAAPNRQRNRPNIHHLPDRAFLDEVMKMGGTPEEILKHQELLHLFLPVLRADFKMTETYECPAKKVELHCDLSALGGVEDRISREDLLAWSSYTKGNTSVHLFDGSHFFIHEHTEGMIHLIHQKLLHPSLV